ncbi:hypothetical protein Y1Q_0008085 [Alligator mississippiensis]|uniref:Uncharacterized protein n=1 Tax=Alligator mississippiensis TaxID=8496 RepID=A0A151NFG3_ALLMI|nr:hypothetical protein Y1Q_0008085 [Alligator mississippiensis]
MALLLTDGHCVKGKEKSWSSGHYRKSLLSKDFLIRWEDCQLVRIAVTEQKRCYASNLDMCIQDLSCYVNSKRALKGLTLAY